MMPTVYFMPPVPDEVRQSVAPLLARWLPALAPSWLHRVTVYWDPHQNVDDGEKAAAAFVSSDMEYRRCAITIAPLWFTETPELRDEHLRHELMHLPFEPLCDIFDAVIAPLKQKQSDLYAARKEQWRLALEGAVCDLTAILVRPNGGA